MHCLVLLFTTFIPSNSDISELMNPYCEWNEDRDETAEIHLDSYRLGGSYSGRIESRISTVKCYEDGISMSLENINGIEIRSHIFDQLEKWYDIPFGYYEYKYYGYMLTPDGSIKCDGAYLNNITNELSCYGYITDTGECICRGKHENDFDNMLEQTINAYKELNGFVTAIDIHF